MADWKSNRRNERFVFRKVIWPTYAEGEDYEYITGGSIELSAFSDLKATASLNVNGAAMPDLNHLLRIYYTFTDDAGVEAELTPIATLFVSCAEPAFDGAAYSATLDCYSTLYVLSQRMLGAPYTVNAGEDPYQKAKYFLDMCGLQYRYDIPEDSYTLLNSHTFDAGESYLTIVNWLLDIVGYRAAYVDAYGYIQLRKYVEPETQQPIEIFRDDEYSILYPQTSMSNNMYDIPNVCRLFYSTDTEAIWAKATNNDPASSMSTSTLKYEKTLYEEVGEIEGDTIQDRLNVLKAMAASKLKNNSRQIEYIQFSYPWLALIPNDCIMVDYRQAGINWKGQITNITINIAAGVPTTSKARKFITTDFHIETDGGITYGAD